MFLESLAAATLDSLVDHAVSSALQGFASRHWAVHPPTSIEATKKSLMRAATRAITELEKNGLPKREIDAVLSFMKGDDARGLWRQLCCITAIDGAEARKRDCAEQIAACLHFLEGIGRERASLAASVVAIEVCRGFREILDRDPSLAATDAIQFDLWADEPARLSVTQAALSGYTGADLNRLSKVVATYRTLLHGDASTMTLLNPGRQLRVDFEQVYVERQLSSADRRLSGGMGLGEAVAALGRIVVLGDPGGGKTTLFQRLVRELSSNADALGTFPTSIVLREFAQRPDGEPLSEYIARTIRKKYNLQIVSTDVDLMLVLGRCVLLFDGLDEVAPGGTREEIVRLIESCARLYPNVPIIASSRQSSYGEYPFNADQFALLELRRFTEE